MYVMKDIDYYCVVYDKYKNLKLASEELGIKWQALYSALVKLNHPVTGDKEVYGSPTDKFARKAESKFKELVSHAKDNNLEKFQSKVDFIVANVTVDVKAATKKDAYKNNPRKSASYRWAFSCKVQEGFSDFLVLFCYSGYGVEDEGVIEKILLVPESFYRNKQSISVSCSKSKWYEFEVTQQELTEFFNTFN